MVSRVYISRNSISEDSYNPIPWEYGNLSLARSLSLPRIDTTRGINFALNSSVYLWILSVIDK